MSYEIDFLAGEKAGCSSRLIIAERMFYVKHFTSSTSRFFSGDQQGTIQKEISKSEFELWLSILADDEAEVSEIQEKLGLGKKY